MDDGLTETQRAFLSSREHAADFEDLSAQDINRMSYTEWAARTGRPTLGEIAERALAYATEPPGTQNQEQPPAPVQEPQSAPQGIDLANLTMAEYSQLRARLGVGGREYGRGALDGGSTADWVQAAQRKAGRSAWQGGNVEPGARPDSSKYLTANEPVQGRAGYYR